MSAWSCVIGAPTSTPSIKASSDISSDAVVVALMKDELSLMKYGRLLADLIRSAFLSTQSVNFFGMERTSPLK